MKDLNLWQKIVGSFDNVTKNALSARKLTAFIIVLLIVTAHIIWFKYALKHEDFTLLIEIFIVDYLACAFFLGIITIQNIIEFKNGKKDEKPTDNTQPDNTGL